MDTVNNFEGAAPDSPFYGTKELHVPIGNRRCNLLLVWTAAVSQMSDYEKIVDYIRQIDPKISTHIVDNRWRKIVHGIIPALCPTLTFSPVELTQFRPPRGRLFMGRNLTKSQEYEALEKCGFPVPKWQLIREGATPDLSDFSPYVVTKPNSGGRGALVKIKRKGRVRPIAAADAKTGETGSFRVADTSEMLAQEFVYTGAWPLAYRVTTLFGKVLHSFKVEADHARNPLPDAQAFGNLPGEKGVSIVASGKGCVFSLNYDEEIIRLGEAAHAAFPDIPLLGVDIVREVPSGKLYILEVNAIGYILHFSSQTGLRFQREFNFNLESQFDGLKKPRIFWPRRRKNWRADDNAQSCKNTMPIPDSSARQSPFHVTSLPGLHHGRRRCQLVLISNPLVNHENDFFQIAQHIRQYDSKVTTTVITNRARGLARLLAKISLPTLTISFVPLARFHPLRGRFLHGIHLSKSQEYSRLEAAGFPVPKWQMIVPDEKPDLSDYGPYVVTKPDRGMRGALVKIKKAGRVRYSEKGKSDDRDMPVNKHAVRISEAGDTLVQRFIYTGQWPISYRVVTLFGQVLHSDKAEASHERKQLSGPEDFHQTGVSGIVASGKGCTKTLNYDEEIIRLGEAAHAAFPEVPLLGFDIVREVPSGKLFILEANAIGYVWHFSSSMGLGIQRDNNFNFESQFDGLRKAAHILADKTQELAC